MAAARCLPIFDAALVCSFAQAPELSREHLEIARAYWDAAAPLLTVLVLQADDTEIVAVRLPSAIEAEIDAAFTASPAQGFILDRTAAALVAAAAEQLVPGLAAHGCAPLPRPHPKSASLLRSAGFLSGEASRTRYAVVTTRPFPGCAGCALAPGCPKLAGGQD